MDWGRAKTGMIVGFLVLNMFLLYRLFTQLAGEQLYGAAVSHGEVRRVVRELEAAGAIVRARVPREAMAMPLLIVRHGSVSEEQLVAILLSRDHVRVGKYPGVDVFESRSGFLAVWVDGRRHFALERASLLPHTGEPVSLLQGRALRTKVGAYLADFPVSLVNACYDYAVRVSDREYTVVFHQEFEGFPVFGSQAVARVVKDEVVGLAWYWVEIIGQRQPGRAVIPATDALSRAAAATLLPPGTVIERIQLGYYVEPMDAYEWEAVPVWRILLAGGVQIMVNAHNGEVEEIARLSEMPR